MKSEQTTKSKLPRVALVGRTNVGKSTLFNKLAERYEALVSDIAGTTRDIKRTIITWQEQQFELYDTGGLTTEHLERSKKKASEFSEHDELIEYKIIDKALSAVKEADLILFVVDARDGLLAEDKEIALWLKKKNLPILLVSNKADGQYLRQSADEFYQLGFDDPIKVSAVSGAGSGDLLDAVVNTVNTIEHTDPATDELPPIRVSIIGRPNVGKSSLLNALIGEERVIVSSTPHTTREPIDTTIIHDNREITLVDTAGIRRKSKISLKSLEKEGVKLSLKSIERSDICLLVIDPSSDVGQQDLKLAELAVRARVGVIIISNKLDLMQQTDYDLRDLPLAIETTFNSINWAPIIPLSALTKKNVHRVFDMIKSVYENRSQIINQVELDELRKRLVAKQAPPRKKALGRKGTRAYKPTPAPRIITLKQLSTAPPHFELLYRGKGIITSQYLKYIEKGIRQQYDFTGSPIIINQRRLVRE